MIYDVLKRIRTLTKTDFNRSDFADMGSCKTVDKVLNRMVEKKYLVKLDKGYYTKVEVVNSVVF